MSLYSNLRLLIYGNTFFEDKLSGGNYFSGCSLQLLHISVSWVHGDDVTFSHLWCQLSTWRSCDSVLSVTSAEYMEIMWLHPTHHAGRVHGDHVTLFLLLSQLTTWGSCDLVLHRPAQLHSMLTRGKVNPLPGGNLPPPRRWGNPGHPRWAIWIGLFHIFYWNTEKSL